MSTTNSEYFRFLNITLGLGILSALPFYQHPMGLQRPDAWMYTILHQFLPVVALLRFHRPQYTRPTAPTIWRAVKIGLSVELGLLCLLGWSIWIGDLHIDLTFQGCKDWLEVQIGQQIELTELPMPGLPSDFYTLAKWVFIGSFGLPWLLWWVYLPHEFVWRGWVCSWAKTPTDWMILSTYWTAWQLPVWLVEPQWHLGWWINNGELFAQQVVSTWLVGTILFRFQTKHRSIAVTALLVSILTVSETWAILIQDTVPFPNWLWIGWNGWWGCMGMTVWLIWTIRNQTKDA